MRVLIHKAIATLTASPVQDGAASVRKPVAVMRTGTNRRAPKGGLNDYRGGQFIPAQLWESEKRKAHDAMPSLLESFAARVQFLRSVYVQNAALGREGVTKVVLVPLTSIEAQMKAAIRETYSRAFLLGKKAAGNLTSATDEEIAQVKKLRLDEFTYLRSFLGDMREDAGSMDYAQRMGMYVNAVKELYWLGYLLANTDPARRIEWRLGESEHCSTCQRLGTHAPYSVAEYMRDVFPLLPCSGKLECVTNCHCVLVDVTPERKELHKSMETEPKKGDVLGNGYVFHHTDPESREAIAKEGMDAGSFSEHPIKFNPRGGARWLAVHKSHLPQPDVHDYGGIKAYEPQWEERHYTNEGEDEPTRRSIPAHHIYEVNSARKVSRRLAEPE